MGFPFTADAVEEAARFFAARAFGRAPFFALAFFGATWAFFLATTAFFGPLAFLGATAFFAAPRLGTVGFFFVDVARRLGPFFLVAIVYEHTRRAKNATDPSTSSSKAGMGKTILVVGFGPGISTAVAEKFGSSGFSVGLVARSEEKLASGVSLLKSKGIVAAAFPANAGDPTAIRAVVGKARAALGPITVIQWNAYGGAEAGDFVTADPASVRGVFDVAVVGLLAAVQEALPDLKQTKEGAILVTNGAFGEINPQMDEYAAHLKAMGLALGNAAKHKLVGLLAQRLKGDGIYVGEVMVAGTVKGTAWDSGQANLDGATIANKFWELYQARGEVRARVS